MMSVVDLHNLGRSPHPLNNRFAHRVATDILGLIWDPIWACFYFIFELGLLGLTRAWTSFVLVRNSAPNLALSL